MPRRECREQENERRERIARPRTPESGKRVRTSRRISRGASGEARCHDYMPDCPACQAPLLIFLLGKNGCENHLRDTTKMVCPVAINFAKLRR